MVEISDRLVSKEDEIELELGLSIGGSFRRSEKSERVFDSRRNENGFDLNLREREATSFRSAETKREAHALRRQEAMKKQREKRCRSVTSHASESESRATKIVKTECCGPDRSDVVSNDSSVQYPYAPIQVVPVTRVNVVPFWTPSFPEFVSVPCRGFRPFLAHPSFALNVSQKNAEVGAKTTSDHRSPMCSSSSVSDPQSRSSSHEGDGSSDTRTLNSSQSSREQSQSKDKFQSEAQSGCDSISSIEDQRKTVSPTQVSQPCPIGSKDRPNKRTTSNKEANNAIDIGKPPRPQCQNQTTPFPQMPYVSAKGSGPGGKTVTGLLYRYDDAEVSIVCVCHGTTFSPAEFVRHAGRADVSHPLRHITVIPPAF